MVIYVIMLENYFITVISSHYQVCEIIRNQALTTNYTYMSTIYYCND